MVTSVRSILIGSGIGVVLLVGIVWGWSQPSLLSTSYESGYAGWSGKRIVGSTTICDTSNVVAHTGTWCARHARGDTNGRSAAYLVLPQSTYLHIRWWAYNNRIIGESETRRHVVYLSRTVGGDFGQMRTNHHQSVSIEPDSFWFSVNLRDDNDYSVSDSVKLARKSWVRYDYAVRQKKDGWQRFWVNGELLTERYSYIDSTWADTLFLGWHPSGLGGDADTGSFFVDDASVDTAEYPSSTRLVWDSFETGPRGDYGWPVRVVTGTGTDLDSFPEPFTGQLAMRCLAGTETGTGVNYAYYRAWIPESQYGHLHFRFMTERWFRTARLVVRIRHSPSAWVLGNVFRMQCLAAAAGDDTAQIGFLIGTDDGTTTATTWIDKGAWHTVDAIIADSGESIVFLDGDSILSRVGEHDTLTIDSLLIGPSSPAGVNADTGSVYFDEVIYDTIPCGRPCGYYTSGEKKTELAPLLFEEGLR